MDILEALNGRLFCSELSASWASPRRAREVPEPGSSGHEFVSPLSVRNKETPNRNKFGWLKALETVSRCFPRQADGKWLERKDREMEGQRFAPSCWSPKPRNVGFTKVVQVCPWPCSSILTRNPPRWPWGLSCPHGRSGLIDFRGRPSKLNCLLRTLLLLWVFRSSKKRRAELIQVLGSRW